MNIKKILFLIMVFVVAAAFYAVNVILAAQGAATTGAKIQIMTKDADLGEVNKGKTLDYLIEVKNMGKEDLIIQNVYSGCGCLEVTDKRWANTAAQGAATTTANVVAPSNGANASPNMPAPVIVKPNHSIDISARLDTNKVNGQFERMVHVISNDPENKDVMWKVKGNAIDVAAASNAANVISAVVVAPSYGANVAASAAQGAATTGADVKIIMVFYSPGCNDCRDIMENFLPKIKEKYGDKILIVDYNIENMESYAFLLDLENKYDEKSKSGFFNPKPPVMFAANKLLYGVKAIKEGLEAAIGM